MKRRSFLKVLGGLPGLAFLNEAEAEPTADPSKQTLVVYAHKAYWRSIDLVNGRWRAQSHSGTVAYVNGCVGVIEKTRVFKLSVQGWGTEFNCLECWHRANTWHGRPPGGCRSCAYARNDFGYGTKEARR